MSRGLHIKKEKLLFDTFVFFDLSFVVPVFLISLYIFTYRADTKISQNNILALYKNDYYTIKLHFDIVY